MPRELMLMRHGKSDRTSDADDFYRPLSERGKRDVERIGTWLGSNGPIPDNIITSPAVRASSTAELFCGAIGSSGQDIHRDPRVYGASPDDLLAILADAPRSARCVLLVGHNPGLEKLLIFLIGEAPEVPPNGKLMPTAALVRLVMPDDWRSLTAGCAETLVIQRPSALPLEFPFPSPSGQERRERPAYYYTQSSAIPYRRGPDGIEILIVTSRKNTRWILPKGIVDPGLTPQASAAKEALEEAGVEGLVEDTSLGRYQYDKWGGICTVDVFPLEVTRILPEADWEETHREREWASLEQAVERLPQPELKSMVRALERHLSPG